MVIDFEDLWLRLHTKPGPDHGDTAEIDRDDLRAVVALVRKETLEEAAKVAYEKAVDAGMLWHMDRTAVNEIAAAIRSLANPVTEGDA